MLQPLGHRGDFKTALLALQRLGGGGMAGTLISAPAHRLAKRVLRNMHDSFCHLKG
jgi:hypothetical protein